MIDLTGKVAVVTGAASGIGRATAHLFASAGATVAAADVNHDGAKETAEAIGTDGGTAAAFHVDVTVQASVAELRDSVTATFGVATVVANVAGWDETQPFVETDRAFWERIMAINLLGPMAVSHAFLPPMIEHGGGGRVVNVASDAGRVGSTGETPYSGAKAGVIGFTKALAREVARYGITVNSVCPGPTDTPLFAQQPERIREALVRAVPFRRLATPEEVAYAIAFFSSDLASYITGQVLSVSGGLTMNG